MESYSRLEGIYRTVFVARELRKQTDLGVIVYRTNGGDTGSRRTLSASEALTTAAEPKIGFKKAMSALTKRPKRFFPKKVKDYESFFSQKVLEA